MPSIHREHRNAETFFRRVGSGEPHLGMLFVRLQMEYFALTLRCTEL